MESIILLLIGLVSAVLATYRLVSQMVRMYRADRTRVRSLRALERDSNAVSGSSSDVAAQLDQAVIAAMREDLTLTGALLALISVCGVFAGRALAFGYWAVGLYTAGLIGIVVGVALALGGAVMRVMIAPLLREDDTSA
jgi:hypothetical protein